MKHARNRQQVKAMPESGQKDVIRYTSCGYHCQQQCILRVRVRDGVIVAVEPDDTVNPGVPREDGYLPDEALEKSMVQARPCAKGYAQWRIIYDPNRVQYPMKRVGNRGEAKFARISWDEALDTIAEKLVETKKRYGPLSILHQPYSSHAICSLPVAPWFGASFTGWDSHSLNGWRQPEQWVLGREKSHDAKGRRMMDLTQGEANVFKSKLIVLWGANTLTTNSGGWAYHLLRARELGIPIVCIEYRYTPTAEVLADQWIPIRPSTDVAMMIAMANVWFKEDLCDKEFIDRFVEPEGLQRWQAHVLGTSDGIDKTPQWAEGICGIPAETIAEFARLYARSKPVNLNVGASIGRQFFGENGTRASMYLQALTGNTCIPGGTAAAETSTWVGQATLPKPSVDWQQKPGSYVPPILFCAYKWPMVIDLKDKLENGQISREEYNNLIGTTASSDADINVQMLMVESNNHLVTLPDVNMTLRALKKIDFIVVSSHYAEMPTARYADILLPQIASAYEGRDSQCAVHCKDLFYFGRNLANYFLYRQKCIEPVGEIRPSDWIWVQIAKRLGLAEMYRPLLANVPYEQWDEVVEDLHRQAYERWATRKEITPLNPPGWEDFQKKPVFRWEVKEPYYPYKQDLEAGENPFKETASGKIEFYSKGLAKGPDYLAKNEFYPGTGRGYGRGNLPPMAEMTMGGKNTFYSQDSKEYPLLLSSPHPLHRVHSFLHNQPLLRGDCYRHAIWISAADARARGVKDNDIVRVYNDIGEMKIPAYVTSRIIPGTVCLFHGGWYEPSEDKSQLMPEGIDTGGAPNLLIHNVDLPETIVGHFPTKGLVQIEKVEGGR